MNEKIRQTRFRIILLSVGIAATISLVAFGLSSSTVSATSQFVTTTTNGASQIPGGGVTFSGPFTVVPSQNTTHVSAPKVVPASTVCQGNQVSAVVSGVGPYNNGPDSAQSIVTLTSTTPCLLSGYPILSFFSSSGTVIGINETDGGTDGYAQPISNVTLGPDTTGSFLIQYNPQSDCPNATTASFQLSVGQTAISIDVNGILVEICGSINVTPIIQGNSPERYF